MSDVFLIGCRILDSFTVLCGLNEKKPEARTLLLCQIADQKFFAMNIGGRIRRVIDFRYDVPNGQPLYPFDNNAVLNRFNLKIRFIVYSTKDQDFPSDHLSVYDSYKSLLVWKIIPAQQYIEEKGANLQERIRAINAQKAATAAREIEQRRRAA